MNILNKKIILASQSPRRKQLLEMAGFTNFTIQTRPIEETFPDDMPAQKVAEYLAVKKAHAAKELLTEDAILLTADSVVIQDDIIYGKPIDKQDALHILSKLSGNAHTVITGVCLQSIEKHVSFSGVSEVFLDPLSEEEMVYYVDTYKPYDKAGAYAIQEWIGLCKINRIDGTYPNIMGLPVDLVYKHLLSF